MRMLIYELLLIQHQKGFLTSNDIKKADPEGLNKKTFKVKTQIEAKFAFFRIRELKSCNTMEIFWVF
jgi:hypothetical protein